MQRYWFAVHTRNKQEFVIYKSLSRLKSGEHLDIDYYLPARIVVSQLRYRRRRSEVPVIRNLVFIRTIKQTACDLSSVYGARLFYMEDLFTRSMLVVPNKQMSDFMFVMDLNPGGVSFDNGSLVIGDGMHVVRGDLTGVESGVAANANRTYVVIRIKDVLTASVEVPESYLKIIK